MKNLHFIASFVIITFLCCKSAAASDHFSAISVGIRSALLASRNNEFGLKNSRSDGRRSPFNTKSQNIFDSSWGQRTSQKNFVIETDLRGGEKEKSKPPAFLKWAYTACGAATTAAWSTCVYTAIRSNQPPGAIMPNFQHGFFARIGALSAVPVILASYKTLISASNDWDEMSSPTCRRQNLALATAGAGSALWVNFAHIITKIPGTEASHIGFSGPSSLPRTALIGAYGAAAALSGIVWVLSLPEDVRKKPFSWPGRVIDGVAESLVSLAPKNGNNPVNVKYSLLASGFLFFTGLQIVGQHPTTVIPSWTSRRLARAFPCWTLLAAVTSYDLKEAAENGQLLAESSYRTLSTGIKGLGATYLVARAGAVFLDSTWPGTYGAVTAVPGWAALAIAMMGYTLRSDEP